MFIEYERSFARRHWVAVIISSSMIMITVGVIAYFLFTSAIAVGDGCKKLNKNDECCLTAGHQIELINQMTHLCCNGTITRHAHSVACCYTDYGSVRYNEKQFKCCNGHLYEKLHGDDDFCCGDDLYNDKTQLCCPLKHHMTIIYRVYEITASLKTCPVLFCNNEHYNVTKYTCCDSKLVPNLPGYACCGQDLFNTVTQVCCNGQQYWKQAGKKMCCGKMYMNEGHKCCGGKILKKTENCCGEQKYNSNVSKCTAGAKVVPISTPLCNNRIYDPEKEVCCGYFAMTKHKPGDNACCKPRGHRSGVTFNNQNMTCRNGRVYSSVRCTDRHTPDRYTCCDGFIYEQSAKNSVCCDGQAKWYKHSGQENCQPALCQNNLFDNSKYECCNNQLINLRRFRCIGDKAYRYNTRKDRFSDDLRPCGIYAISKSYSCCADLMPYKNNEFSCPFKDFGNQKPIKPHRFPFWPLITCRSKQIVGKIVDVSENGQKIQLDFIQKFTDKQFIIEVSNHQRHQLLFLKNHVVTVYYEKFEKNRLFIGEYGAIKAKRRHRNEKRQDRKSCEKINSQFQTNSSFV